MKNTSPKTICFFNSNKAWGGGEKWHLTTAAEFQSRGHNIFLVANTHSQLRIKGTNQRIPTYAFSIGNLSFLNPFKVLVLMLFFRVKKIETIILNLPADLKVAGLAAKLAGVKKIIYRRGMPHPLRGGFLNRFYFTKILTHIIVNSQEIARSLEKGNEAWFPIHKLKLIYNGMNLDLKAKTSKRLIEKNGHEWLIGSAGRLTSQKGQIYLIEMAKILKQQNLKFRILIAGEGELRQQLEKEIKLSGLTQEIKLLGHLDEMAPFMNSLDVFVFPSLYEGSANTLIETLYYGVPVVAFNTSSNPEIIEHGKNGFLARPQDPRDLAHYVTEVIALSSSALSEMKRHAQEILERKFDNAKIYQDLEGLF
jgi:glycosyltransferase involved in cell wall biosynthesis